MQIEQIKDKHKGQDGIILTCGPSVKNIVEKDLDNKVVLAVKQTYNLFPDKVDYHFWNCCNLPKPINGIHYSYGNKKPFVIASSNFPLYSRWSPKQHFDIFFQIPDGFKVNRFVCVEKQFHKYDITYPRVCGPGIMYETVLWSAFFMGFSKLYIAGWDVLKWDKGIKYSHFQDKSSMYNPGYDASEWELQVTKECAFELIEWIKPKTEIITI